jgi:hypothetical protein
MYNFIIIYEHTLSAVTQYPAATRLPSTCARAQCRSLSEPQTSSTLSPQRELGRTFRPKGTFCRSLAVGMISFRQGLQPIRTALTKGSAPTPNGKMKGTKACWSEGRQAAALFRPDLSQLVIESFI